MTWGSKLINSIPLWALVDADGHVLLVPPSHFS